MHFPCVWDLKIFHHKLFSSGVAFTVILSAAYSTQWVCVYVFFVADEFWWRFPWIFFIHFFFYLKIPRQVRRDERENCSQQNMQMIENSKFLHFFRLPIFLWLMIKFLVEKKTLEKNSRKNRMKKIMLTVDQFSNRYFSGVVQQHMTSNTVIK